MAEADREIIKPEVCFVCQHIKYMRQQLLLYFTFSFTETGSDYRYPIEDNYHASLKNILVFRHVSTHTMEMIKVDTQI